MQTPGTYISAVGHVGLIGWLLLGWGLSADPLEFDAVVTTVVSSDEFAALTSQRQAPITGSAEPDAPPPPVIDETVPPAPNQDSPTETTPPPDPVAEPISETPPPPPPPRAPPTEVTDALPDVPDQPAPPPSNPELTVSDRPTPRDAPTIAPIPTAPPPPDTPIARDINRSAEPLEADEPEVIEEPDDPPTTTDTTVARPLENEQPSGALETSMRPQSRPSRPTPPAPEPVEEPVQTAEDTQTSVEPSTDDAAVAAALEAALAADAPAVAKGPPLTGLEESAFRLAVSSCWVVDNGSAAASVVVEVEFSLDRERRVVGDVTMVSATGGDDAATRAAFGAARRAILRCAVEGGGYQLPLDKYESWKDVVLTFDPSSMRLR